MNHAGNIDSVAVAAVGSIVPAGLEKSAVADEAAAEGGADYGREDDVDAADFAVLDRVTT